MPQGAVDVTGFLTIMAALSAASQTLVENVLKKRWAWLDEPKDDKQRDKRRQAAVHGIAFVVGGALAWTTGLQPLALLGLAGNVITNSLAAGVLVSYGGSLFDEGLGAVRAFKKAQEDLKTSGRIDARGEVDRRGKVVEEPHRR